MAKLTAIFDVMDKASRKFATIHRNAEKLDKKNVTPIVDVIDKATKKFQKIDSTVEKMASKSRFVTVKAVDMTSRTIGTVRRSIFSLPTMVTIGLAVVGVDKLKDSTVGAAMTFETYLVSMNHWLKGNKKAVEDSISWLDRFAARTPMTMEDLFPAYTRAIGISNGDLKIAKQLTSLATDMASLTPGKTVGDAMEAIADAQMGEFERMKEFSMKITKEEYKAIGGWAGFINKAQQKFKGGAQELSKTSIGMISTINDSIQTQFRSTGQGILESLKPRLQRIVNWLDNNQGKWNEWKQTLQNAGTQGAEWILSRLEGAFGYIQKNYLENDKFKKLDFEGKVNFVLGDINKWWKDKAKPRLEEWWDNSGKPWAIKIGGDMGEVIFNGIVEGTKKGLQTVGGMWVDAFKNPSIGNFGGAAIGTIIAAGIGSMLLSPILKGLGGGAKALKGGFDWLKGFGKENKQKIPKQPSGTPSYSELMKKAKAPSKTLLKGATKGVLKKVPFLGTALSIFDIFNAKGKSGKLKAVGSAGGSALGGLLGSFFGPVGTISGAALGGYLGGKAMGLFGGGDSKSHVSASPHSPTMPNINMQDYLRKNIYQPLNQAITNSKKFGQAFANSFILGMNGIKISNWNITALYQPLNQAITNARLFGQAFAKTFMIGVNETPVSLSNWNITALYHPLNQAVLNSRLFGQAFAKTFVIGANESQASIHPWISQQIYIPLNQMVSNAQAFGIAFTSNFIIGLNSVKDTPFNWISDKIYKPILQAVGNALAFGQNFALNFKIGMTQAEFSIHSWISINLYQPIIQAIGNAKLFGISYARNIGIGVNGSPIDLHPWISSNLYQPILQSVGNAISFGSAFVGNFIYGMRSRKEDVSAEARSLASAVERAFRSELGINSPSRVMADLGYWSAMGVIKGFSSVDIKKFMEKQIGSIASFGGKVGGNVKQWLTMALMATGTPMSWLGPLYTMAIRESGGNPRAINLWDSNAKRGTPSKGLMQTIDPTFNAYKLPSFNDIWNPVHNAIAAIRYIKARYGSVFNTPGIKNMSRGGGYKGYEKGGIINRQHLAIVGEKNKKEAIIPLEQHRNRALGLLSYAASKLGVQPQTLPSETVQVASGTYSARSSIRGMIGDIIIQITGDNHYSNDMDAERVGKIAFEFFKRKLEEEYFEGGAMAIYE
jgi:SLT domain-containing protein